MNRNKKITIKNINVCRINKISDEFSMVNMQTEILNHTQPIKKMISRFTQRFQNEDQFEYDILNNDSLWTMSIPEESSGTCFTYNPQIESDPGYWYSMMNVPNIEDTQGSNYDEKKRNLFNEIKIFLHKPNHLFYFLQEEAPNNIGIDLNWLQLHNKTRIVGN